MLDQTSNLPSDFICPIYVISESSPVRFPLLCLCCDVVCGMLCADCSMWNLGSRNGTWNAEFGMPLSVKWTFLVLHELTGERRALLVY